MEKLTKNNLEAYLQKAPIELSEDSIKSVFDILGFKLKEYSKSERQVSFEIHYKTLYIIRYTGRLNANLASFSNEYVNFGESTDGISIAIKNLKELIIVNFNLFMPGMKIGYEGIVYIPEDESYTQNEMEELAGYFNSALFDDSELASEETK